MWYIDERACKHRGFPPLLEIQPGRIRPNPTESARDWRESETFTGAYLTPRASPDAPPCPLLGRGRDFSLDRAVDGERAHGRASGRVAHAPPTRAARPPLPRRRAHRRRDPDRGIVTASLLKRSGATHHTTPPPGVVSPQCSNNGPAARKLRAGEQMIDHQPGSCSSDVVHLTTRVRFAGIP